MKFAIAVALATVVSFATSNAWAQQCPNGTYPTVDQWGNNICKRMDGRTATTEVPHGQQCPNGAYPTVDNYGNSICRSFDAAPNRPHTDYYDTSKGCPNGTYPTVDSSGNNVCKRF